MKKQKLLLAMLLSFILAVFAVVVSDGTKVYANNLPADFYYATKKNGEYHMDFTGVPLVDAFGLPVSKVGNYMYSENGDPEEPEGVLKAYAVQWVDGYWEPAKYTYSASTIEIARYDTGKDICFKHNTENYLPFCVTYDTIANIALVYGEDAGDSINSDDTLYIVPVETFEGIWLRASVYDTTSKKEVTVSSVYSVNDFADALIFRLFDSSWKEGKEARISFGLDSYGYTVKIYEGSFDSISEIQAASAKDITSQVLRTDYDNVKTDGLLLNGFAEKGITFVFYKGDDVVEVVGTHVGVENQRSEINAHYTGIFVYDKEDEERYDLSVDRKMYDAGTYPDTNGTYNLIEGVKLQKIGTQYYGEPKYLSLVASSGKVSTKKDMSFIVKAVEGEFDTLEDAKNEKDIKNLLFSPTVTKGYALEEDETYMFTVFFKDGTTGRIQVYLYEEDDDFIIIESQPEDAIVGKGEVANFGIEVYGPHVRYLWQYKLAGSDEWVDWNAKRTASITVAYASYRNGMKLRCYLTNDYDNEKYSDEVTLTYSSTSGIKIDETNFPDPLFREYVSQNFDEDGNGVIYPEEMVNYTSIYFTDKENVTTLKGIEFFTELEYLSIWNDGLKSIDLSNNKKLKGLYADGNKLAKIDLGESSIFENLFLFGELSIEKDEEDGHMFAIYKDDHGALYVDLNTQVEVGEAGYVDVVRHPEDVFIQHNRVAYFDVAAYSKDLKYQWYYMLKGESEWTPWSGKTTPIISVAYASYRNGMKLKCFATQPDGEVAESGEAVLIYYTPLEITNQPVSVSVNQGELAYFEVKAKGDGLKYLWQYKLADSSEWVDWESKTTAKIDVAYASYRNGMKLRCLVTDVTGDSRYTVEVQLKYKIVPKIARQPKSTTVNVNSLAYFEVVTEGSGLKYLWQYKAAGSTTWTNWTSKKTAKISVAYADYRDGMSFRCIVTDASGKTYTSSPAVLTYKKSVFKITADPLGTSAYVGESAEFEVKAEGSGLKYLWQYKLLGTSEWVDWNSKTTAKISVAYASYRDGMMVRCKVTNSEGKTLTSGEAALCYVRPFAILSDPVDTTVKKNSIAYFEIKASGEGLTYQWFYKNESDDSWSMWTSKTTAKISVAYANYRDGMRVKCLVTDERGMNQMSEEANLWYED